MNRTRKTKAFTLVEIMIVVLIIGILLAIAVPNFIRARETSRARTCSSNLKQIDSAKEQYAMENRLGQGDSIPDGALWAPDGYIKNEPECPSGGTYDVGVIGDDPTCSYAATDARHSLANIGG
jgi:prepilin-type N-terminal cleavage/methylation domain-containing protein